MKSMIVSIFASVILMSATVAKAESVIANEIIAQIAVPMPVESDFRFQQGTTHAVIKLQNDGSIKVEKWFYEWSRISTSKFQGSETIVLKDSVARMIRENVIALSNAEIKTTYSDVVCMMMPLAGPSPSLYIKSGYDHSSGAFGGDLRVVESNTGCWAHEHINLVNEYDVRTAATITASLQVLAFQLMK